MTSHDFAVWMHGFTELTGGEMPSPAQWKMIVEHLNLVFNKVTPPLASPSVEIKLPVQPPRQPNWTGHMHIDDLHGVLRQVAKKVADDASEGVKASPATPPAPPVGGRKTVDDMYDDHFKEVQRKAAEAREAERVQQLAEKLKRDEIARQRKAAQDAINTPKGPQGPNRFSEIMKRSFPDAAAEQERKRQAEAERKRIEDYYKDRTRVVPFFPQSPQPFQFEPGQFPPAVPGAPVSPSPGYPFPYYTLGVDANKTLIC